MSTDRGDHLRTFTIYYQPELPRPYRVREFHIVPGDGTAGPVPGDVIAAEDTLDAAREQIPWFADVCYMRAPEDPPEIVETWI